MQFNPVEYKPTGTFADAAIAESIPIVPTPAVGTFRLGLYHGGVLQGWLGQNSSEWAILVDRPEESLILEQYPYNGVTYYRISGTSRYMSVSDRAYVGFYNWIGARGWTVIGSHLRSDYNGNSLSLYSKDNRYLYAWDGYTVLDVNFQGP